MAKWRRWRSGVTKLGASCQVEASGGAGVTSSWCTWPVHQALTGVVLHRLQLGAWPSGGGGGLGVTKLGAWPSGGSGGVVSGLGAWPSGGGGGVVSELGASCQVEAVEEPWCQGLVHGQVEAVEEWCQSLVHPAKWRRWRSGVRAWCMAKWRGWRSGVRAWCMAKWMHQGGHHSSTASTWPCTKL